jgi:hypothetical protein
MDDKKKPEASWEERAQLGPYQLDEQMPQPPHTPDELYLATHEKSGATALVLKPAEENPAWLKDFRVYLVSSEEQGYLALQVEDSRRARAPDRHSADSLMFVLRDARKGLRRMARAIDGPREPRRRRQRLALVGAAALGAVLFALVSLAFESTPQSSPMSLAGSPPVLVSDEVQTAGADPYAFSNALEAPDAGEPYSFSSALDDAPDAGESMLARPLPSEPFKGQKRPPCRKYAEVELVGACWVPHELKAPCLDELFEHKGKCYVPVFSAKPPPQSVGE